MSIIFDGFPHEFIASHSFISIVEESHRVPVTLQPANRIALRPCECMETFKCVISIRLVHALKRAGTSVSSNLFTCRHVLELRPIKQIASQSGSLSPRIKGMPTLHGELYFLRAWPKLKLPASVLGEEVGYWKGECTSRDVSVRLAFQGRTSDVPSICTSVPLSSASNYICYINSPGLSKYNLT